MSYAAIKWAWSIKTRSRGSKCTLVCLADHADKSGRCWPSQRRLAEMTGASIDTVQRDLREFMEKGLITVGLRNTGSGRKSSVYTLQMPGIVNEQPKPQPCGLGQTANQVAQTAKSAAQTAIVRLGNKNPQLQPSKTLVGSDDPTPVIDEFDSFWAVYPKRDGDNPKKTAKQAFVSAVKHGAKGADIIAGAKRFAEKKRTENQIGTRYIPMATNWLRQERWIIEINPGDMPAKITKVFRKIESQEWKDWNDFLVATTGRGPFVTQRDLDRARGSWFDTPRPPPLTDDQKKAAA